jgi:hypothetical protein
MPGPTIVQKTPGNRINVATSGTLALTFGSAVTAGNKVIVSLSTVASGVTLGSITDDKANSYGTDGTQTNASFGGATFVAASLANITNGPTVISIPASATGSFVVAGIAYEVSACGALDVYGQFVSSFGAGPFTDTFTTAHANEYGFGILQLSSVTTAIANNGWAIDYADTADSIACISIALPTAGSNSAQFTPSGGSSEIFFQHATYQAGVSANTASIAWVT